MSNDFINSVITEFAQSCQLGDLSFDSDDCCHLIIDKNLAVTLHSDQSRLTIAGQISQEKPSLEALLSLSPMLNDEPAIGWSQETGLIGYKHIPQQLLTVEILEQAMGDFLEWMKHPPMNKLTSDKPVSESGVSLPALSLRV